MCPMTLLQVKHRTGGSIRRKKHKLAYFFRLVFIKDQYLPPPPRRTMFFHDRGAALDYRGSTISPYDVLVLFIMVADAVDKENGESISSGTFRRIVDAWESLPLISTRKGFSEAKNLRDLREEWTDGEGYRNVYTINYTRHGGIWQSRDSKKDVRRQRLQKYQEWTPRTYPNSMTSKIPPRISPSPIHYSARRFKPFVLESLKSPLRREITGLILGKSGVPLSSIAHRTAMHVLVWMASGRDPDVLQWIGKSVTGTLYVTGPPGSDTTLIRFFRRFVVTQILNGDKSSERVSDLWRNFTREFRIVYP